jgi:hypothetical protein
MDETKLKVIQNPDVDIAELTAVTKIKPVKPKVSLPRKGKRSVNWYDDVEILSRLSVVAELMLRRATAAMIAQTLNCSIITAKRDVGRVKELWRSQSLETITDHRAESVSQYRMVQQRAWEEYLAKDKKTRDPRYLATVIDAQSKIDELEGTKKPTLALIGNVPLDEKAPEELTDKELEHILLDDAKALKRRTKKKPRPRTVPATEG